MAVLTALRDVGFWYASDAYNAGYPRADMVSEHAWDDDELAKLVEYTKSGAVHASYRGYHECRLCGAQAGSRDFTAVFVTTPLFRARRSSTTSR